MFLSLRLKYCCQSGYEFAEYNLLGPAGRVLCGEKPTGKKCDGGIPTVITLVVINDQTGKDGNNCRAAAHCG